VPGRQDMTCCAKTVFIVDDDEAVRDSLEMLLTGDGLKTATYGSGEAFLNSIVTGGCGCVLLDLHMPGMGGLEVQARLASERPVLSVILMTGRSDAALRARAAGTAAVALLEKPIHYDLLLSTIRRALDRGAHPA